MRSVRLLPVVIFAAVALLLFKGVGLITNGGYVLVGKQQIEFEVPDDFNPVPVQVAMLEAEKEKAMQEFNIRVARINEQISKLQALPYSDENVVDAEVSHGQ